MFNSLVVPDPPQNITVDTKGSRVINISWTAGFDGNCAIKNYTVEISQHDQILKDVVCQGSLSSSACVVSSLSTTASLTGLLPWTTYNIRVFARNKIGRSSSSPILNVTTDEEGMLLALCSFSAMYEKSYEEKPQMYHRNMTGDRDIHCKLLVIV